MNCIFKLIGGGIWIDDEEFYIPYIPRLSNCREWRETAMRWLWYYNIKRRHYGKGMGGKAGWIKLKDYYSWINIRIAYFPPLFLDNITTQDLWIGGQHVLDKYNNLVGGFGQF